jgi:hypothetical protein
MLEGGVHEGDSQDSHEQPNDAGHYRTGPHAHTSGAQRITGQFMSRLAADLARALDPVSLSRAAGIEPDPWQADLLRSDDPQVLLNCSRQSGKSTTTGILAYHVAAYRPPALVLLLSPTQRQSGELFRKVKDVHNQLGQDATLVAEESALRVEFANGSRVVCLPGSAATVRSYSAPSLIVIDEAAQCEDELYEAIRPMLAVSHGRLVLLSAPFGRRGFFFDEWVNGGDTWKRVKVPADQCPRITPEFLTAERERRGSWYVRQEFFCEFVETDDQVFGLDLITDAITSAVKPLFPGWRCSQ